jgi:hypothetical protein
VLAELAAKGHSVRDAVRMLMDEDPRIKRSVVPPDVPLHYVSAAMRARRTTTMRSRRSTVRRRTTLPTCGNPSRCGRDRERVEDIRGHRSSPRVLPFWALKLHNYFDENSRRILTKAGYPYTVEGAQCKGAHEVPFTHFISPWLSSSQQRTSRSKPRGAVVDRAGPSHGDQRVCHALPARSPWRREPCQRCALHAPYRPSNMR